MFNVHTIDLKFLGQPGLIASYLIEHSEGLILIESGPGSTVKALEEGLDALGFSPGDVHDLFVTHIHLDHAGAAGWLAAHGAHVHVHHRGYPHLADPSKLMASAARIYGDQMDTLWGQMLPVPKSNLSAHYDEDLIEFGGFRVRAVDTPGHANHHMAYVVGDIVFSGDVGGIRLEGPRYLLLPMPPPEFHLERWQASCRRLGELPVNRIAPTHFGIFQDAGEHINLLGTTLSDTADWIERHMPSMTMENFPGELTDWMASRANQFGLAESELEKYETANPSRTSAGGIWRYWNKYRREER